jgi:hypothetical protein
MLVIIRFRNRFRTVFRRFRTVRGNFKNILLLTFNQIFLERFGGIYQMPIIIYR